MPADLQRDSTKFRILELLKYRGTMTINDLVDHFEISKTAMRAHLVALEDESMIVRQQVASEGRGRPPLAFGLTERGAAFFPSTDSALLTQLIEYLEEEHATDLIRGFFEKLWADRRSEFLREVEKSPTSTLEDRLQVLESLLARYAFMPVVEIEKARTETSIVVRECNCPFPAAVRATRIPCQLEARFLAEVIGATPLDTSLASKRNETCTFEFELEGRLERSLHRPSER